jgi:L-malate glycosyltransferase
MRKLAILYVDTEKVWRGGQEQLLSLMTGMKNRGHAVWLAAPPQAPLLQKVVDYGIGACPFRQRSELSPLAFFRIARLLRSTRFDVIHFNTPRAILAGGLAARACRIPICVSSRRVNFPLRSRLSRHKYTLLQNSIFTVSVSIRETLVEGGIPPAMVKVVYEGVDLEWIDRQLPRERRKKGEIRVGMVAHLSPEKGHRTMLEAISRLSRSDTRYFLVGDGVLREELERFAEELGINDRVVFTGFRSDCEAFMKTLDLFCLPSLSEGLSSAILAAMANRLPVLATEVGGIPELVINGETGLLVPPGDSARLTGALARLLSSAEERTRLGLAGRRRIEEHFTLAKKISRTEELYLELLKKG